MNAAPNGKNAGENVPFEAAGIWERWKNPSVLSTCTRFMLRLGFWGLGQTAKRGVTLPVEAAHVAGIARESAEGGTLIFLAWCYPGVTPTALGFGGRCIKH